MDLFWDLLLPPIIFLVYMQISQCVPNIHQVCDSPSRCYDSRRIRFTVVSNVIVRSSHTRHAVSNGPLRLWIIFTKYMILCSNFFSVIHTHKNKCNVNINHLSQDSTHFDMFVLFINKTHPSALTSHEPRDVSNHNQFDCFFNSFSVRQRNHNKKDPHFWSFEMQIKPFYQNCIALNAFMA